MLIRSGRHRHEPSLSHITAVLSGQALPQHRRKEERTARADATATTQIIPRKSLNKGDERRQEERRQETFDRELGKIFTQVTGPAARQTTSACATTDRRAPRKNALVPAALSQNLTFRCTAPKTIKRSRALTVRAEYLPGDSSRSRKGRPASGRH